MEKPEYIESIRNAVEAQLLHDELEQRGIPHLVVSYYDSAYDGLFQMAKGWGHVEAPPEFKAEVLAVLGELREKSPDSEREVEEAEATCEQMVAAGEATEESEAGPCEEGSRDASDSGWRVLVLAAVVVILLIILRVLRNHFIPAD